MKIAQSYKKIMNLPILTIKYFEFSTIFNTCERQMFI